MKEPRGKELVERYKANYEIPVDARITEEMVLTHWELEKNLTKQLISSTPENRWETFERCYTELYEKLPWLNLLVHQASKASHRDDLEVWKALIDSVSTRIYEVGSGKGEMINFLAQCGNRCVGTDVTRERGRKYSSDHRNLTWEVTDGVHLDKFTLRESYDVVLSDQVIEHLHPDDLLDHFRSVYNILSRSGGRYIFRTPHVHHGPSDISKVFKCDKPKGMHLKEYTFAELCGVLRLAGFTKIGAVLRVPRRLRNIIKVQHISIASDYYLKYLLGVEKIISMFPTQTMRRSVVGMLRYPLFSSIFMVAQKF
jgi:SAM-dependent methyltransferase